MSSIQADFAKMISRQNEFVVIEIPFQIGGILSA
jgi:hypothetical protein